MKRQVEVDWQAWERNYYNSLTWQGKVWYHLQNISIRFFDLCERLK